MEHSDHQSNGHANCPACELGPFTRNNYFTGKLMVERDFTDEARFHIDKLRHHHQRLHGWGVVCGLKVKQHENPACRSRYVCIEPGTAIDCCGHEILVREEECIDITQLEAWKALKKQEQNEKDPGPHTLQICLSYRECCTENVPVLFDECGCDDTKCAPNRILESYDIGLLIDPDTTEKKDADCKEIPWRHLEGCPHCDTPDCIVLATITDYRIGNNIEKEKINNRTRRLLPSTQTLYEMIECVMERGPGGGGADGKDGLGIDDVKITQRPCDETPATPEIKVIDSKRTLVFEVNKGCDGKSIPLKLPRIVAINWPHNGVIKVRSSQHKQLNRNGIVVAFEQGRPVLAETLSTQSVQLLFQRIENNDKTGFELQCYCNVRGKVTGVMVDAKCGETISKILDEDSAMGSVTGARFRPTQGGDVVKNFPVGEYRVVLEGDFILGSDKIDIPDPNDQAKTIQIHPALDANHMGPGLLGSGQGRCPTGDGIEGGRFVSWFTISEEQ